MKDEGRRTNERFILRSPPPAPCGFGGGFVLRRISCHCSHTATPPATPHNPSAEVLLKAAAPSKTPSNMYSRAGRGVLARSQRAKSHKMAADSRIARLSLLTEALMNTNIGVKAVRPPAA